MVGERGGDLAAAGVVFADEQHLGKCLLYVSLGMGDGPQPFAGEPLDDDRQEGGADGGALADLCDGVLEVASDCFAGEHTPEVGGELLDRDVKAAAEQGADLDVHGDLPGNWAAVYTLTIVSSIGIRR